MPGISAMAACRGFGRWREACSARFGATAGSALFGAIDGRGTLVGASVLVAAGPVESTGLAASSAWPDNGAPIASIMAIAMPLNCIFI